MIHQNHFDRVLEEMLGKVAQEIELPRVRRVWVEYRKSIGQRDPCPARCYEEAWSRASSEQKVALLKRELPSSFKHKLERQYFYGD